MTRPSTVTLRIEDDFNDLGFERKREAEPFPREMVTLAAPMSWPYTAQIEVPARMSADEFDRLIRFLEAARPALVKEPELIR
jgi:hypothetical protein